MQLARDGSYQGCDGRRRRRTSRLRREFAGEDGAGADAGEGRGDREENAGYDVCDRAAVVADFEKTHRLVTERRKGGEAAAETRREQQSGFWRERGTRHRKLDEKTHHQRS